MTTDKTTGPTGAELLLGLSAEGKNIFAVADAQAIANESYKATASLLSKMVRKRWLVRLVPGKYLIVPLEAGLESIPVADRYVIARSAGRAAQACPTLRIVSIQNEKTRLAFLIQKMRPQTHRENRTGISATARCKGE